VSESQNDGIGDEWDLDKWAPALEGPNLEHFKWAWSETEGELVWRVSGPGDGLPYHEEQVQQAWGREPSQGSGDVLGIASYEPAHGSEHAHVSIYVYYGGFVPAGIVRWFQETFPEADVSGAADPTS